MNPTIHYVDLYNITSVQPSLLLAQVCIGLLNRRPDDSLSQQLRDTNSLDLRDQYYANLSITWQSNADTWLDQITAGTDPVIENISVDDLLLDCKLSHNVKGYIRYDYEVQKLVVPNLVTLAAVLDAALVDDDFLESFVDEDLPMIFDATEEWSGFDAYDATEYMYENHIASTQGEKLEMRRSPPFNST